ncbi:WAT1-related protein At4g08300-like [Corylus avellana]|uniref:WAT1-related protein At4g08300-like n=1 Tax=Corylus avellana TaxID=13451 RepID=UPI00286A48DC|nr:WAT1-related protein At4g08300-like [Corylus avellana]
MAPVGGELKVIYKRFKPHILMVLTHMAYTFLYLITDISFHHGMNAHVFVTYRHALGGLVIFPFAYFLERKVRPKMTVALFLEIFVLSLVGVGLTLNMYFASLKYTSPTFVTSVVNTVPSLTFVIAVALRMESLDVRHPRGIAKVLGTLTCLAGVIVIALYEGAELQSWKGAPIHIIRSNYVHENWIKGPILAVASSISWSIWYVMQGITMKKYPAPLSLTTWINFVGGAQSAVFTVLIQHKPAAWSIPFNIEFWNIVYAGIVCSGLIIFVQLWCTVQKGPVFVTIFNPFGTVLVGLQAYFLLGERMHMGRIVGAVIIILGLYLVLWGKEGDQYDIKSREKSFLSNDEPKEPKIPREEVP